MLGGLYPSRPKQELLALSFFSTPMVITCIIAFSLDLRLIIETG
jgi:hypothetical protein